MDVRNSTRRSRWILLAVGLYLAIGTSALADPVYTAIELGTSNPIFGNGTITGSNGMTYAFNPVQNYLPAQWQGTTQGVPVLAPPPAGSDADFNPNGTYSYSYTKLDAMNSQGLAAGVSQYGVSGTWGFSEVVLTQLQPNGSWGVLIPIWQGAYPSATNDSPNSGILGISPSGQVLGYGPFDVNNNEAYQVLYVYDTKTHNLINVANSVQFPVNENPTWFFSNVTASQLDNDGRILVHAYEGYSPTVHELLLVPQGVSATPLATPEPATWVVFATLIGGCLAYQRIRARNSPA